jgi:dephospho-CoA kinase
MKPKKQRTVIIIGVTGSLGTGKTTVAKIFKGFGAVVFDADKMAHDTFKKDTPSYKKIVSSFGKCALDKFGRVSRPKLAGLIFGNKKALNKLCAIIHPEVIAKIKKSVKMISRYKRIPAVVIDAPLLIEAKLHKIVDYLIVVKTSRATQVKRTAKKTGLSARQIRLRIKNQMPLRKKIRMADFVIDNEGDKSKTRKIIKRIWNKISKEG